MTASSSQSTRILIVKLSSLGDLFHALPTVHDLRVGFDASVDWVVQEEYVDVVGCFNDVERVIPFSRRAFLSNLPAFYNDLRLGEYDLVIDLQGLLKSAGVTALARGRRKIGPSFNRECSRLCYQEIAGERDLSRHAVDQNRDVLRHLKQRISAPVFPVSFPKTSNIGEGVQVAMLPKSRWPSKNWPPASFVDLARLLLKEAKMTITLLGGPADISCCQEIEQAVGSSRVFNLAGKESLPALGSRLEATDLLISNDSGPVHMAVAVGTPTLVLFGPTDPERTGPFGQGHRVIQAPPPCCPCYLRNCTRHGAPCMNTIEVSTVADAAFDMLALLQDA
jgi:heptosyltransferase-1